MYPRDIYGLPTVQILDQNDVPIPGITVILSEGRVEGNVTLMPLNTSNSGVYTCVSGYDIPEAGLDLATYFTEGTTTLTVTSKRSLHSVLKTSLHFI